MLEIGTGFLDSFTTATHPLMVGSEGYIGEHAVYSTNGGYPLRTLTPPVAGSFDISRIVQLPHSFAA